MPPVCDNATGESSNKNAAAAWRNLNGGRKQENKTKEDRSPKFCGFVFATQEGWLRQILYERRKKSTKEGQVVSLPEGWRRAVRVE